jgi:hypothetical protein
MNKKSRPTTYCAKIYGGHGASVLDRRQVVTNSTPAIMKYLAYWVNCLMILSVRPRHRVSISDHELANLRLLMTRCLAKSLSLHWQ